MSQIIIRLLAAFFAIVSFASAQSAPATLPCAAISPDTAEVALPIPVIRGNCLRLETGFSADAGSFARLSERTTNLFGHSGATLSLGAEIGMRRSRGEISFTKNSAFGITIYGERSRFNQSRDSSLLAFQPDITEFNSYDLLFPVRYRTSSYGATFVAERPVGRFGHLELLYSYDETDVTALSAATADDFRSFRFQSGGLGNAFNGIRTSKVTPSFNWNTVDNAFSPTHGQSLRAALAVAGLGGNVNSIEPSLDFRYFHPGFHRGNVIAFHLNARMISGFGGKAAPPIDRYYAGGENDVRGFDSTSISPLALIPGYAVIPLLTPNGVQITRETLVNGVLVSTPITQEIPVYASMSAGGDTKVVANFEYRIHIAGPLTLALFDDVGLTRVTFRDQTISNRSYVDTLNATFQTSGFSDNPFIQPNTQKPRMSMGTETQVHWNHPRVPLRFYWAWNPLRYQELVRAPIVFDPSALPNLTTLENTVSMLTPSQPITERRFMFRIAIGRTF